ncbi:MAG: DNA repair protein RecN, partial [Chloroflexi bacterium]|nr:DNA repair protein RecN [Chloroflexota bacterium]
LMLAELRIDDFAIIDQLEITFSPGLITFTGETGAGKSIIIDAVELLLGGRAEVSMIRSGAKRAMIEATFQIPTSSRDAIQTILEGEDLFDDPEFFTIGREIRIGGRSVARLNGRNVSAGLLKEIGELLVDLHGQSEHLSLLRVKEHLNLLDRYARDEKLLNNYSKVYQDLVSVNRELTKLHQAESEAARQIDLLNYQINEIHAARLEAGEDENLVSERNRLANAENLASSAQQALIKLDEGTPESPSVTDLLGQILDEIKEVSRLDASQIILTESFQSTFSTLTDLSRELRKYSDGIEFNPARLNQVEERLELISNLKRKYGDTIPAILDYLESALEKKETITHAGERIAELEQLKKSLLINLGEIGQALSEIRHRAAEEMEREIESELDELNMSGARFEVDFQEKIDPEGVPISDGRIVAYDATGIEQIEFLIAPNPGEGLKPLVKIASGGETSRLMLALKNVLARADNVPTLIFDEIDQGIGGRVGTVVGYKLWLLSRHHQVLCVTHLPQLAAFGEQHLQVSKQIQNGRTITRVIDLDEEDRLPELAQMLGETSDGAMHSARDMLQAASTLTNRTHD